MMSLLERDFREVLHHLRRARQAMGNVMCMSGDWTAVVQIEEEFRQLRAACTDFARYQAGIDLHNTTRKPRP
jgi:hypothetical protein